MRYFPNRGLARFFLLGMTLISACSGGDSGGGASSLSYTLTITNALGTGSGNVVSNVNGIDCGQNCSAEYAENTQVKLTAIPDTGSEFLAWTGDNDCNDGLVKVTANISCRAIFNLKTTHLLSESPMGLNLWTQSSIEVTTPQQTPPSEVASGLGLNLARQESEDVLLVFANSDDSISLNLQNFTDLGVAAEISFSQLGFVSGYGDTLTPFNSGDVINLNATDVTPLLLSFYVPAGAIAGLHETTLNISTSGHGNLSVPVKLYVFDFDLPATQHFSTRLNVGISGLVPTGGNYVDAYNTLFRHRITPNSATYPSGFTWNITWDSSVNPSRCVSFYDEFNENPDFSIKYLADKYLHGNGWNGVGFDDVSILYPISNGQPRPTTFCGQTLGSSAYDTEWFKYLTALRDYLQTNNYLDKVNYQVMNEPQNQSDYDTAADLCTRSRLAAPGLKLAITEEAKPEIAEHASTPCGYDIWISYIEDYEQQYAWQRMQNHSENVWLYNLDYDINPFINPTILNDNGSNQRALAWVAWAQRIKGWSYYNGITLFSGANPRLRLKRLRDSFEDYEYFYLANGGSHPSPSSISSVDELVASVATGLVNWSRDPKAILDARLMIGYYLDNTLSTAPFITSTSQRRYGSYYINFQDTAGEPVATPLVIDNQEYIKIGWDTWNNDLGYGWYGLNISNSAIAKTAYSNTATTLNDAQRSYIYDDYGRPNLFNFALENGLYQVTVAVGIPDTLRSDYQNVTVEGQAIIDELQTSVEGSNIVTRTINIDLKDGMMNFVVGGKSRISGVNEFTFLDYITIVALN